MSDPLWQRLQLLVSVLSVLLLLALLAGGAVAWRVRASLPQLDGTRPLAGLAAPVRIERDDLGVPTVTGASRTDVARATGFLHAQDRFFQMDLLRRSAAGEAAELFGAAAVPFDQARRIHGFRPRAAAVLARLPPDERALLAAYVAGVNAGLGSLDHPPWEYAVLRTDPAPWREEDSLLVIYAMWLDLQDTSGRSERSLLALRDTLGSAGVAFLAPRGTEWDSALDGTTFPAAPLPPFRFSEGKDAGRGDSEPKEPKPGSNSFALAGRHTRTGVPLLANDPHLDHRVPNAWYRAVLAWTDPGRTPQRLVGLTLPGLPFLVIGSNGRLAWGYTNAYVDTADVVFVERDPTSGAFYRTADGFREIAEQTEPIAVKGAAPASVTVRRTEWGPLFGTASDGTPLALRWTAHEPDALNLAIAALETASRVGEAVAIAHRAGMPSQNLIAVDAAGGLAWTITGRLPRRRGYDGRQPATWAYGDRRWDGWLRPDEIPAILDPADGLLWSANQRMIGGTALELVGDGGYDEGARGAQIRDDLRALVAAGRTAGAADLLAIQLDDRARFLERWQRLLLSVLTDSAVADHRPRRELRDAVQAWNGRASVDSAAFRLVRTWRRHVATLALAPFVDPVRARHPEFRSATFQTEDALWRLATTRPPGLLHPACASWEALLLRAADETVAEADRDGVAPEHWTWGRGNRLAMQHPFSRMLPGWLGRFLDMPAAPLPGAPDMPRVQTPGHGASARLVVSPGREEEGLCHLPGGQSGNPCSPFYRAGHAAWVRGEPTPLLPGPAAHTLVLSP